MMELQLYANRNQNKILERTAQEIRDLINKNYNKTPIRRFHESMVETLLFPFEFILAVLLIIVSPFNKSLQSAEKRK